MALHSVKHKAAIANVSRNHQQLPPDILRKVIHPTMGVERIVMAESGDLMSPADQELQNLRPDKAVAPRNEYLHSV